MASLPTNDVASKRQSVASARVLCTLSTLSVRIWLASACTHFQGQNGSPFKLLKAAVLMDSSEAHVGRGLQRHQRSSNHHPQHEYQYPAILPNCIPKSRALHRESSTAYQFGQIPTSVQPEFALCNFKTQRAAGIQSPNMPGEVIDRPNPPPLPSNLPHDTLNLQAKVEKKPLDKDVAQSLKDFQHAACYIAGCKCLPLRPAAAGRN